MNLRIGSRSSPLALKQVEIFVSTLKEKFEFSYEIVPIKTSGDLIQNKPLYDIGGKALFLKELEFELKNKTIDIAIHSLKDVPGDLPEEFILACYIGREYPNDAFISEKYKSINQLPLNAKVGTCSPRRIVSLKYLRPDLEVLPLRGNIETRLKKLRDENFDAIILAEAGLRRSNVWNSEICYSINPEEIIPAVGQGIIAAEILSDRHDLIEILSRIKFQYKKQINIEREFLKTLSADCDSPVAAHILGDNGINKGLFMYAKTFEDKPVFITKNIDLDDATVGKIIATEILSQ
jgi:hydroxymethylbilane synthase